MRVFCLELLTFKAGGEYFGIEVRYVYRVVKDAGITPIPLAPPSYLGLMYYRGELFDAIDVVSLLGNKKSELKDKYNTILVKWSEKKLALIPDVIVELLRVENWQNTDTVYAGGNYNARMITPEYIWNTSLNLPYGPDKI
jgi:chemotaxis signal transduction protein